MKSRNGFVSNSSSSSFLIAYTKPIKCKVCGRQDTTIEDVFINESRIYDSDKTCIHMSGNRQEVLDFINEQWCYGEETYEDYEDYVEWNEEMKKHRGHKFAIVRISYYDERTKEILDRMSNVTILGSSC